MDAASHTQLLVYLQALNAALPAGTTITSMNDVYDAVLSHNASLAASQAVFKVCTDNELVFQPVLSDPGLSSASVYLESSGPDFYDGRTVSHLSAAKYTLTSDFLIVPDVTAGVDARKLATSGGGFLGPSVLAVMNTLGYTVNVSGSGIVNSLSFGNGVPSRAPALLVQLATSLLALAALAL